MARLLTVAELDLVSGGNDEMEEIVVVGRRRQRDTLSWMAFRQMARQQQMMEWLAALNSAADGITAPDGDTEETYRILYNLTVL